jgi:hypothetical protein
MDHQEHPQRPPIITEDDRQPRRRRTIRARSQLYRLIAQFRKDADNADDPDAQAIFEYAADTVARLASAFKRFDERMDRRKLLNKR